MQKKNKKIVRYRKPVRFHFSTVLFCVIFLYMAAVIVQYVQADKIQIYQVSLGSITDNRSYRGLIMREEEVRTADSAGYVNYYVQEGSKVRVGTTVCTLDEDGQFSENLSELVDGLNGLSREEQQKLKEQLNSISLAYRDEEFYKVGEAKLELESSILDYLYMAAADDMKQEEESSMFQKEEASFSGVVTYRSDGMENLTLEDLSPELFEEKDYRQTTVKSGDQVEAGSLLYRLYTGRTWTILFPMNEEDVSALSEKKTLNVRFPDSGLETSGNFSIVQDGSGNSYGQLEMSRYALEYLTKRYVDIEILGSEIEGYQIPVSSVVTKEFFTVPEEFLTRGGNTSSAGFHKKTYDTNGNESIEFIVPGFYAHRDGVYYISGEDLTAGTLLVKPDSEETYQLGATAALQGVYNINRGYTQFDPVEILGQKEDFYIISPDTDYGVSVYDHIVLNGNLVEREKQVIY